jgi:hypothetical protein
MPRRALNFSLGTLMLGAISISALIGGILELNRNAEINYKQMEVTTNQLYDIAWRIRAYMDQSQSEFYPATLESLNEKGALDFPQRYFTNPRFAELDEAFVTISGIKRQDSQCIWLYENLPPDCHDGRLAMVIQGEALVPMWFSEEEFRLRLKESLKRTGTCLASNNRKASISGWPIPGAKVESDRIVMGDYPTPNSGSSRGPSIRSGEAYYFNIRSGHTGVSLGLYVIAFIAGVWSISLFIHNRRTEHVTA